PSCVLHGFLALPWIEGRPLSRGEASTVVLDAIASYLASSIAPPISREARDEALARSEESIRMNAGGALSKDLRARLEDIARSLLSRREELRRDAASSKDGCWAPHAFIRQSDARIA